LLHGWAPIIERIELISSSKGRFEVTMDGDLLYSKAAKGRHAGPGEVSGLVRDLIGPEIFGK
jgi:predicted Rdx family selenoprotein